MLHYRVFLLFGSLFFLTRIALGATAPVEVSSVDILSNGTRISATVYVPIANDTKVKLPAIAMAHGWGGKAAHLSRYASEFSSAGFLVVAFDYRGWGRSDSRMVQTRSIENGEYELVEYKGVVDPIDQAEDYIAVVNWLATHPKVDVENIGLWGTSWSGGTVVYVAARDSRIKALVSQVSPVGWPEDPKNKWLQIGGERSRGIRGYPAPFKKEIGNLTGGMIWERLALFNPRNDVHLLKHCASLFLVAEHEELFDNNKTALVAYRRAPSPTKYTVIPGATHYSVYDGTGLTIAINEAVSWFKEHLK
ncbi:alpha/beta fold hydrolase [Burkholderiales bacterium]|nr:alpha/beta fold hydrolase [Burkholderiales bacterium]